MLTGLQDSISQETFASMVGISQPRVAQLLAEGVLERAGSAGAWLRAYCDRLREQAAGRGQELTIERAALARSQRVGQDLKNAIAQGEYAPIGLLTDVLAAAASAVVDRFDALPGELRKACPDLPEAARSHLQTVIASARNEWVRATSSLVLGVIDDLTEDADDSATDSAFDLDDEGPAP